VNELRELRSTLSILVDNCKSIYGDYQEKRERVIGMRKKHHSEFDYNSAWAAPVKQKSVPIPTYSPDPDQDTPPLPLSYRALYDFESRNPDELSFRAGSVIQVRHRHKYYITFNYLSFLLLLLLM
jgi:hypothetical protein